MNPLIFLWEGDCFRPIPRHTKECDARYVIGEHYALEEIQERSTKSHAQYFAALKEAWLNLPERFGNRFPTPEHLRKHALIATGYFNSRSIQASSKAEALRLAAFIRPANEYAIVTTSGSLVEEFTAKSQKRRAMPKKEFQESKSKVLDYVACLIDVKTEELTNHGNTV